MSMLVQCGDTSSESIGVSNTGSHRETETSPRSWPIDQWFSRHAVHGRVTLLRRCVERCRWLQPQTVSAAAINRDTAASNTTLNLLPCTLPTNANGTMREGGNRFETRRRVADYASRTLVSPRSAPAAPGIIDQFFRRRKTKRVYERLRKIPAVPER